MPGERPKKWQKRKKKKKIKIFILFLFAKAYFIYLQISTGFGCQEPAALGEVVTAGDDFWAVAVWGKPTETLAEGIMGKVSHCPQVTFPPKAPSCHLSA